VNFNYFIDEQVFSYILDAAALVAEHGWGPMDPPLSLAAIRYVGGKMLAPDAPPGSFRFISAESSSSGGPGFRRAASKQQRAERLRGLGARIRFVSNVRANREPTGFTSGSPRANPFSVPPAPKEE
jgi:hypothetical protein